MGLFTSKYEKLLDSILAGIRMNMANNYKDAAQSGLAEYEEMLQAFAEDGKLKEDRLHLYEQKLETLRTQLRGYTHKDQKPYWQ